MTGTWASGWATGDIVTAAEFKKGAGSIFDTTLGASAATIDLSSILGTYAHLLISMYARGDTAAANTNVLMRFNGDSAANYDWQYVSGSGAVVAGGESFAQTGVVIGNPPANTAAANLFGVSEVFIPHYANAANNKAVVSLDFNKSGTSTGNMQSSVRGGAWRSNAAINRVTLLPAAGNFVAGTRVTIYAFGA